MIPDITAFVPIKLESLRVPGKNIRKLGDKPLCQYVLDTLLEVKKSGYVKKVCVYCSSPSIAEYLPQGVELVLRSPSLDGQFVEGIDIYQAFQRQISSQWYLLCHTTSPFLHRDTIIDCIKQVVLNRVGSVGRVDGSVGRVDVMNSGKDYDSAMTVARVKTFSWFNRQPLNYTPSMGIPRTQTLNPVVWETSGLYLFPGCLLESGTRVGDRPYMKLVGHREAVDIDTEDDWELAEAYAIKIQMGTLGLH